MGVQGLWELLAPVGRRVSVETLAGKKLAIDASIWMIQFMKAMRDEKGDMLTNAHILGFFRRICKLLFLRTKPVFVFDGATPSLKRRTIASRRRHRDNAQAKIRKTAEKLLLNHLKAKRLEELAQELKKNNTTSGGGAKEKIDDTKGKQVVFSDHNPNGQSGSKTDTALTQEALDEMLAASLAAEEEGDFNGNKMTSDGNVQHGEEDDEDEDEDEDEEMIYPVTSGNIDPSVLASLPPSMQLDLLVQMRERLMAENRQKYQKIKKAPTKFSELQIQSYLKTVAFRREIDEVQKCAAGRGVGGVQSSRIASEANREFIFSSSFSGDKQMLSAKTAEKNGETVNQSMKKKINLDSVKKSLFTSQSQSSTESSFDKVTSDFGNDVETYCDESGRVRVSRVRGLGIHMTRDLQRNLDLMNEYEQNYRGDVHTDLQLDSIKEVSSAKGIHGTNSYQNDSVSNEGNSRSFSGMTGTLTQEDKHCSDDLSLHGSKSTIEISFLEDDSSVKDTDDNLFQNLVSGTSTSTLFSASIHSDKSKHESSESEYVWEKGKIGEKNETWYNEQNKEGKSSLAEDNSCEEYEVEWEQGDCDVPKDVSHCQAEQKKTVSRGLLEEEDDIQEAIRRSLQDRDMQKDSTKSSANTNLETGSEDQNSFVSHHDFIFEENRESTQLPLVKHPEKTPLPRTIVEGGGHLECSHRENVQQNVAINFDGITVTKEKTIERIMTSSELYNSGVKLPHTDEDDGIKHHINHEQCRVTSQQTGLAPPSLKISREDFAGNSSDVDFKTVDDALDAIPANAFGGHTQISESSQSVRIEGEIAFSKQGSLMKEKVMNVDAVQEEVMGNHSSSIYTAEGTRFIGEIPSQEELENHDVVSESNFDEELSLLRQERLILGDEQRKLERNAESVSSEMFAECQELLQMFGLPYIIAPMEAEAQCAYMEMSNLVDGVVTDDSDVFLFGARNVYKNIFDDRKYVETYFMKDIENELGLNRETLIRMALLLGSDYTEGVSGIGIVNAIEVVRAFPEEDGLQKFREWVESPDPSILGKLNSHTGSNSKKRSLKSSNKDGGGMGDNAKGFPYEESISRRHEDQPSFDDSKQIFMTKHRNVSKNWHLPSSFPSESVITAYTSPQVDDSKESFMWGKPDLFLLRKLCWERFGWDNKKADELLVPVLKEYDKHETQLRLEAFYTFNERFAKIRSQRIKKAVKGITGKCSTELMDDLGQASSSGKKRGCDSSTLQEQKLENCSKIKDNSMRKASSRPRRLKTERQNMQSENGDGNMLTESQRVNTSSLAANLKGRRGRGRERSSGRGRGRGRGEEEELNDDSAEASYSDDCGDTGEMEKHLQVSEAISELRRSTRHRKHVKYTEEEVNVEVDAHISPDTSKEQESVEQCSSFRAGYVSDHEEGGNQSPGVSLSRDYILSGAGFCMDESKAQGDALHSSSRSMTNSAEKDTASGDRCSSALDCQTGTPSSLNDDNSHSRDYLLSGGGFCRDESEMQVDTAHLDAGSAKEDREADDQTMKKPTGGNSPAIKRVDSLYPEEAEEEGGANLGLRAMPSLRKRTRRQ